LAFPAQVEAAVPSLPNALIQMTALLALGAPPAGPRGRGAAARQLRRREGHLVLVETAGWGSQRSHALTPVTGTVENVTGALAIGLVVGAPTGDGDEAPGSILVDFSLDS
jgi:hypothetical protein